MYAFALAPPSSTPKQDTFLRAQIDLDEFIPAHMGTFLSPSYRYVPASEAIFQNTNNIANPYYTVLYYAIPTAVVTTLP